jgi:CO/xanthine dehydrogenase Mo-binding subunit
MRYVGKPLKRIVEDVPLITGRATYVNDISLPSTLHAVFVRSQYAHAKFKVHCQGMCFSAQDFPVRVGLAEGEATYVGQPLAVVLAEDHYTARDLASAIEVEYDPLPAVVDPTKAIDDSSPKARSDLKSNVFREELVEAGDVGSAMKRARAVVEGELLNQRLIPSAMETRGAVAFYDGNRLTMWSSTQSAFFLKKALQEVAAKMGVRGVRAIQPAVGGAFGSKLLTYPEELALGALSIMTRRPIKWINTRAEDISSTNQGRDMRLRFKAGVDQQGRIVGIEGTLIFDAGAPIQEVNESAFGMATTAARMITGHYDISNVKMRVLGVNTNKTIIEAYRGAGRPEGSYFIERIINLAARKVGVDQYEIRQLNAVKEASMLRTPTGITHDSGKYAEALERAKPAYMELKARRDQLRSKGELAGVGVAFPAEIASFGPYETAKVKLTPGGRIQVVSGSGPHGQGDGTTFAMITAEAFQVDPSEVEVLWGDTDLIADGQYTAGSRTAAIGGAAVHEASIRLREKLAKVAAESMGVDLSHLEYSEGKFINRSNNDSMDLSRVFDRSLSMGVVPEETYSYVQKLYYSPYGVHVALVKVDLDTGEVRVLEYRAFDDVGTVINPLTTEGQVHGAVLQGVGQALYEAAVYGEDGTPMTVDFSSYHVPKATDFVRVNWTSLALAKSDNPIGAKGIGELGTIAATPAVINAVEDALNREIYVMPLNPETVLKLIKG